MRMDTLAVDFGTSNSAAAILRDGQPHRLEIEAGADTLPTAVFFPTRGTTRSGGMEIGTAAGRALIGGDDGRYMRALKSVLGTSLAHEPRLVGGKRRTLLDIVTAFLEELKQRAENISDRQFSHVLSGRPVHFHTKDVARDKRAEDDLRACYHAAGFDEVAFMYEPEAAAVASHALGQPGQIGLIVDIGGGTSDFSVFQAEEGKVRILASHGIRLGGTDFDHAVSMTHAMPHLGHGGALRREFGGGVRPVPNAMYSDLATWAKIPFLYAADTRRNVAEMAKLAVEAATFGRLETVLREELGHELAFAVERGKISANSDDGHGLIDMGFIETGITAAIDATSMNHALTKFQGDLHEAARETLRLAGTPADTIGTVVLVGGSSLMRMVTAEMQTVCPNAEMTLSEAFTAVVDGLALAAPDAFSAS